MDYGFEDDQLTGTIQDGTKRGSRYVPFGEDNLYRWVRELDHGLDVEKRNIGCPARPVLRVAGMGSIREVAVSSALAFWRLFQKAYMYNPFDFRRETTFSADGACMIRSASAW